MKKMVVRAALVASALAMAFALCACDSLSSVASSLTSGSSSYEPELGDPVVTTPVIAEEGVLRVGVDASNTPFAMQSSGKVIGLDVDIAAAVAEQMGLKLQIVDVGSDPTTAISEGTVDIVMSMDESSGSSADSTCWLSDPYIESAVAVFSQSSNATPPSADSATLQIEAQSSSMSAWQVTNHFGESALKTATDLKSAFADLASGSVSYVASDTVIGSYVVNITETDAHIVALMQSPSGYCIGVSATNATLQNAVKNALAACSSGGVLSVIQTKWLGEALDLSSITVISTTASSDASSDIDTSTADVSDVGSNAVTF